MFRYNIPYLALVVFSTGYFVSTETCNDRWAKKYINGPSGEAVFGDKNDLINAVSTGASVRVQLGDKYFSSVENLSFIKGEICGQSLFHISKATDTTFQNNAYWWFVILCTNGRANYARYNVGQHVSRSDTHTYSTVTWFVRNKCNSKPELRILKDGTVASGSISNIVKAVKEGSDVKIMESTSGYTFSADNLAYSQDESEVGAQSLWHVSQSTNAAKDAIIFQSNAYWWFTIWSTSGKRDMSRWSIGEHTSRGHTDDTVAMEWFVDSCWKPVYQHDENGGQPSGSLTALIDAVKAGHRVKLVIGRESIEPSFVQVKNGVVSAQLLDSASKANIGSFQANVYWYWRIVNTQGNVKTVRYRVGSTEAVGPADVSKSGITWLVDTRSWRNVLSVSKTGLIQSGSKQALEHVVRNGATVRYSLEFTNGAFSMVEADNLAIADDGNIGAMNVRSVSVAADGGSGLKFQNNPYWWFTITSTQGKVDMSRWTVGAHTDRGHSQGTANVKWFVSE